MQEKNKDIMRATLRGGTRSGLTRLHEAAINRRFVAKGTTDNETLARTPDLARIMQWLHDVRRYDVLRRTDATAAEYLWCAADSRAADRGTAPLMHVI